MSWGPEDIRRPTVPKVSITKDGHFNLNVLAYRALGSPSTVQLLYDRDSEVAGMRAADGPNAYRVSPIGGGANWRVAGSAFTNHYGLRPMGATEAELRDGMLCWPAPAEPVRLEHTTESVDGGNEG